MAQSKISLNLSAAAFTLSYRFKGPSVIIPGQDQNYYQATQNFSGETPQRGISIPQVAYCENTVPTAEGYRSVAYKYFIDPPATAEKFVRIITLFDGYANSAIVGITADRSLYIVSSYTNGEWVPLPLPVGYNWTNTELVTTATVNGNIVFHIERVGFMILEINNTLLRSANEFVKGLDPTTIKGVVASHSYLIAFNDDTVFWSSTEDGLDFIPSLITGAGSSKPDGGKGRIVFCKEIAGGFIIYFEACIISSAYTSNLAVPWIFSILAGGAGVRSANVIGYDLNMTNHFAWTSAGLIGVELHQANNILPQVTDFIATGLSDRTIGYETYPVTEFDSREKEVRLAMISNRYVCISFGYLDEPVDTELPNPKMIQSFVWDTQLKRWGKLNIDHIQIFEAPFTASPPVFF